MRLCSRNRFMIWSKQTAVSKQLKYDCPVYSVFCNIFKVHKNTYLCIEVIPMTVYRHRWNKKNVFQYLFLLKQILFVYLKDMKWTPGAIFSTRTRIPVHRKFLYPDNGARNKTQTRINNRASGCALLYTSLWNLLTTLWKVVQQVNELILYCFISIFEDFVNSHNFSCWLLYQC